jgi:Fungal specific transcription factor domain
MLKLCELQDRVHIHLYGKAEKSSAAKVTAMSHISAVLVLMQHSGKLIAALETRLTYLEALLGRPGLFPNERLSSDSTIAQAEQSLDGVDDLFTLSSGKTPPVGAEKTMEVATDLHCKMLSGSNPAYSILIGKAAKVPTSTGPLSTISRSSWVYADSTAEKVVVDHLDNHWMSDNETAQASFGSSQQHKDQRLPPRHEAISLVQDYFDRFNHVFPLFHQHSFMRMIDRHYMRDREHYPEFWAALNVALALSYRFRAMSSTIASDEDTKAWAYLQNALQVVPDLVLRNPDLLGIQAVLGIAVILQGTPNPKPASTLVATAIRMSQHLGLQRKINESDRSTIEKEQYIRVFWIAYILDKDFSLQLSQPPLLHDDNLSINLPSEQPEDGLGYIQSLDGSSAINFFRLRAILAIIEERIYTSLHSSGTLTRSPQQRSQDVQELELMLENWKHSIPIAFRSDSLAHSVAKSEILHMVVLHLCYFNCLTMAHRVSLQNTEWTAGVLNYSLQGSNAHSFNPSYKLCVPAARASMRLIHLIPRGNYACMW